MNIQAVLKYRESARDYIIPAVFAELYMRCETQRDGSLMCDRYCTSAMSF